MSNLPDAPLPGTGQTMTQWPGPAHEGVLLRRVVAYVIDLACIGGIVLLLNILLLLIGIGSLGLLLPVLGPVFGGLVFVPPAYHVALIGGNRSATFGMRAMGIEVRVWHGGRPGYLQALLQTACFYVSLLFWPVLAFALFNAQRRCLHDYLCGTIVVRTGSQPVVV